MTYVISNAQFHYRIILIISASALLSAALCDMFELLVAMTNNTYLG